jgi:hypothetical protein
MARRNRITIEVAANGDILGICSDLPADVYQITNHRPDGLRIHKYSPQYGIVTLGARAVDASLAPPGTAWDAESWWAAYRASSKALKPPTLLTEEEPHAIDLAKQLARVRDLLVKQKTDDELIDAIDQAIADNEMWMSSDPTEISRIKQMTCKADNNDGTSGSRKVGSDHQD